MKSLRKKIYDSSIDALLNRKIVNFEKQYGSLLSLLAAVYPQRLKNLSYNNFDRMYTSQKFGVLYEHLCRVNGIKDKFLESPVQLSRWDVNYFGWT